MAAAYNQLRSAERLYRRDPSTHDAVTAARKHWRATSSAAKALCWMEFTAQVQPNVRSPLNWSVFKQSKGSTHRPLNALLGPNDSLPTTLLTSLNNATAELVRSAIPPALPSDEQERVINDARLTLTAAEYDTHPSNHWVFTPNDIKEQCKRQRDTAPGPDSIPPALLRAGGNPLYEAMAALFNFSWQHSVIPKSWTSANVVLLSKGAGNPNQVSSYRPVSLTSAMIRTFEHLQHTRLVAELDARGYFNSSHCCQFGFRSQHSTSDAIGTLLAALYEQRKLKRCIPVAFLDLRKAFDRVDHSRLLLCLKEAGIGGRATKWIAAFLRNRTIRVIDRGYAADWHRIDYGVPQGSVLAPLLFLLFIHGATKAVDTACHGRAKLNLFADDLVVYPVAGPLMSSAYGMHQDLQDALTALDKWARSVRMEFNPAKSKVVVFGSPNTKHIKDMNLYTTRQPLRIGFPLDLVDKYEYLGLWLTSNLSWVYHASMQLKRARHDTYLLCRLLRPPSAPFLPAVRRLVMNYLIPRCTYAMEHWTPTGKLARQLQEQMARPIRKVLGLPSSTHTVGVLVNAGIPSFQSMREHSVIRCTQRIRTRLSLNHPAKQFVRKANEWTKFAKETWIRWLGDRPPNEPIHKRELEKVLHLRTQQEWRSDAAHLTSAPLVEVIGQDDTFKTSYLRVETGKIAMLRTALRMRRALTQHTRARFKIGGDNVSPLCTHPTCSLASVEDTVQHLLLECPRHADARTTLRQQASSLLNGAVEVTLAVILGSRSINDQRLSSKKHRSILQLSAQFLRAICNDRLAEGLPQL